MEAITTLLLEPDLRVRKRLEEALERTGEVKLAGILGDLSCEEVCRRIDEAAPEVFLLGINKQKSKEMELLHMIRKKFPKLPVIVLPRHDKEGAAIAIEALKSGAVEYINKTMSLSGSVHSADHFMKRLVPVIKAVPRLNKNILVVHRNPAKALSDMESLSDSYFEPSLMRKELLVIVGCLGGVPSLYYLLSSLPESLPVPVVVVQHMPKIFTSVLAADLDDNTKLTVREASDGSELKAGQVYIAPGDYHMVVNRSDNSYTLNLHCGAEVKGHRPSIDTLIKSTRSIFGSRVLLVYLSGGGNDGIEGAEVLDTAGGQIIIQNRSSSLLWDLPFKIEAHENGEGSYALENLPHQISRLLK